MLKVAWGGGGILKVFLLAQALFSTFDIQASASSPTPTGGYNSWLQNSFNRRKLAILQSKNQFHQQQNAGYGTRLGFTGTQIVKQRNNLINGVGATVNPCSTNNTPQMINFRTGYGGSNVSAASATDATAVAYGIQIGLIANSMQIYTDATKVLNFNNMQITVPKNYKVQLYVNGQQTSYKPYFTVIQGGNEVIFNQSLTMNIDPTTNTQGVLGFYASLPVTVQGPFILNGNNVAGSEIYFDALKVNGNLAIEGVGTQIVFQGFLSIYGNLTINNNLASVQLLSAMVTGNMEITNSGNVALGSSFVVGGNVMINNTGGIEIYGGGGLIASRTITMNNNYNSNGACQLDPGSFVKAPTVIFGNNKGSNNHPGLLIQGTVQANTIKINYSASDPEQKINIKAATFKNYAGNATVTPIINSSCG